MVMPPGRLEDGILVVSMSGSPLTGSGKSFTPWSRTHWANLKLADCCLGVRFPDNVPGGCSALQALVACFHTAGLTLTPYWNWFFGSGSGKSLTPCARMHSANFTALSRAVSSLLLPAPELLAVPTLSFFADPFEQPAPTRAIAARPARAANGLTCLLMF